MGNPESSVYERVSAHGTVLLAGIVGSTAYGLAKPGSDVDRLGVYAAPTLDLCGLKAPEESRVYSQPCDAAFHEAAKYLRLALACNPTITELLWLPEHEVTTQLGEKLIALRTELLSAKKVRDAYLGYARSQLTRLQNRENGTFSSDTANRSAKHARHMARLVNQGYELYTTGKLTVAVDNPDWYHSFSEQPQKEWETWFTSALALFDQAETCLPENPNTELAEEWLRLVRVTHLPESITRRISFWLDED